MSTPQHASRTWRETSLAVFNMIVAAAWCLIGVVAFGLSMLSVHGSLVPLLLLAAGGLMCLSALRLLRSTRSRAGAVWPVGLAAACALSYSTLFFVQEFGSISLDPGTAGFVIAPGVIALIVLAEAVYLWRLGAAGPA